MERKNQELFSIRGYSVCRTVKIDKSSSALQQKNDVPLADMGHQAKLRRETSGEPSVPEKSVKRGSQMNGDARLVRRLSAQPSASSLYSQTSSDQANPPYSQVNLAREKSPSQTSPSSKRVSRVIVSNEERRKSAVPEYQYVTGFKLGIVIVCVTLVIFLMMLDMSIISTAVPRITSDFHSLPDVGWYGSAYLLANCALGPLTGKIYSQCSSKWTFLTFLSLFELGSLICGVATSSNMLIVGRAVAGIGGSGLVNGALTIISACVPLNKSPIYLGIVMSVSQMGTVLGPLIGGALTQYTSWRWCFYINLPTGGLVAAGLFFVTIPDRIVKTDTKPTLLSVLKKLDLVGFALFAPTAIQLLLALQWGGNEYNWGNATIIGLFCGSFATFCVFLFWEYRKGDAAMIPFSMVGRKIVWSASLVNGFFLGSMLITAYYMPIYFQAVKNATPTDSGVYTLPGILTQIIFATTSGILVSKLGYYLPWSLASGFFTAVGTGLLSTLAPGTSTAKWIGYQMVAGSGRGMGMQIPIIAIQNDLPPAQIPMGMAIAIFTNTFGGALFLSFAQTSFTNGLKTHVPEFAPTVDAHTVIEAGASEIRKIVPAQALKGVLEAYNESINEVFYIAAAASVMVFLFSFGMGWKSVKKPKKVAQEV